MATIAGANGMNSMQELFLTGLKNAHAMEKQALSIMTPQFQRIEHYPEVAERLRQHIAETNDQLMRIDEIFDSLGSRASGLERFRTALEQNLSEEVAMAEWIDQSLPLVTRRYAQLYAEEGVKAAKV
jgi:ferritin-like metal-binding protein YciE